MALTQCQPRALAQHTSQPLSLSPSRTDFSPHTLVHVIPSPGPPRSLNFHLRPSKPSPSLSRFLQMDNVIVTATNIYYEFVN